MPAAASGAHAGRGRYVSLLSSFRSMLKEEPTPLSHGRQPIVGVVTPSKVNKSGRSAARIHKQQQGKRPAEQPAEHVDVLGTETPSKVAVGYDFR